MPRNKRGAGVSALAAARAAAESLTPLGGQGDVGVFVTPSVSLHGQRRPGHVKFVVPTRWPPQRGIFPASAEEVAAIFRDHCQLAVDVDRISVADRPHSVWPGQRLVEVLPKKDTNDSEQEDEALWRAMRAFLAFALVQKLTDRDYMASAERLRAVGTPGGTWRVVEFAQKDRTSGEIFRGLNSAVRADSVAIVTTVQTADHATVAIIAAESRENATMLENIMSGSVKSAPLASQHLPQPTIGPSSATRTPTTDTRAIAHAPLPPFVQFGGRGDMAIWTESLPNGLIKVTVPATTSAAPSRRSRRSERSDGGTYPSEAAVEEFLRRALESPEGVFDACVKITAVESAYPARNVEVQLPADSYVTVDRLRIALDLIATALLVKLSVQKELDSVASLRDSGGKSWRVVDVGNLHMDEVTRRMEEARRVQACAIVTTARTNDGVTVAIIAAASPNDADVLEKLMGGLSVDAAIAGDPNFHVLGRTNERVAFCGRDDLALEVAECARGCRVFTMRVPDNHIKRLFPFKKFGKDGDCVTRSQEAMGKGKDKEMATRVSRYLAFLNINSRIVTACIAAKIGERSCAQVVVHIDEAHEERCRDALKWKLALSLTFLLAGAEYETAVTNSRTSMPAHTLGGRGRPVAYDISVPPYMRLLSTDISRLHARNPNAVVAHFAGDGRNRVVIGGKTAADAEQMRAQAMLVICTPRQVNSKRLAYSTRPRGTHRKGRPARPRIIASYADERGPPLPLKRDSRQPTRTRTDLREREKEREKVRSMKDRLSAVGSEPRTPRKQSFRGWDWRCDAYSSSSESESDINSGVDISESSDSDDDASM